MQGSKFIGGPHSKEKILHWLQFNRKKLLQAAICKKILQNKLNLIKISWIWSKYKILSVFGMFLGRNEATGMPQAGRVFETPVLMGF